MKIFRRTAILAITAVAALTVLPAFSATPQSNPTQEMRIGVIGSGSLGGSVGRALVKGGHEVMFSSRNPDELRAMAKALGPKASVGTPKEAAAFGEVILTALPYSALPSIGQDLKSELRGKIVIDASNPTRWSDGDLYQQAMRDGVGATSARLLPGTRLVRGFSAVNATAIEASSEGRRTTLAVPIASDDQAALEVVAQLVHDAKSAPVITGNLESSRQFEDGTPIDEADTDEATLRSMLKLPKS
ncbi:NAD(P)-binding domain-containing protein [Pseudomonas cichorii]|nr:NAD(P)-binding domain-containing protein [Pseudomonas cichorii]MBX8511749.1 NAD(P)-binding domain-containing protein [Pseudomonas cichorii]MBX8526477.1 NAD(P)-binding domain-containing protein [Pseudomonas cichorii]MBX8548267.1 NAD(P)-binding domain-containing protein [Pseudomonas cichorii]MBX8583008.1 NAD(P)-binding domain-containing protein [Pseudomonas cichorii]